MAPGHTELCQRHKITEPWETLRDHHNNHTCNENDRNINHHETKFKLSDANMWWLQQQLRTAGNNFWDKGLIWLTPTIRTVSIAVASRGKIEGASKRLHCGWKIKSWKCPKRFCGCDNGCNCGNWDAHWRSPSSNPATPLNKLIDFSFLLACRSTLSMTMLN